jgi:hypothetical protein
METISFKIYVPDGKFHLTTTTIVFGVAILMCSVSWLADQYKSWEIIRNVILCIGVAVFFFFVVSSPFRYQVLAGEIKGEIVFTPDAIIVNNNEFKLQSVCDLDFVVRDYHGQRLQQRGRSFYPRLLQGVDNYVTFTDNKGQTQTIYFRLETEHHYQDLAPFINQAIKLKKMDFKRGIDLVGIENVSI